MDKTNTIAITEVKIDTAIAEPKSYAKAAEPKSEAKADEPKSEAKADEPKVEIKELDVKETQPNVERDVKEAVKHTASCKILPEFKINDCSTDRKAKTIDLHLKSETELVKIIPKLMYQLVDMINESSYKHAPPEIKMHEPEWTVRIPIHSAPPPQLCRNGLACPHLYTKNGSCRFHHTQAAEILAACMRAVVENGSERKAPAPPSNSALSKYWKPASPPKNQILGLFDEDYLKYTAEYRTFGFGFVAIAECEITNRDNIRDIIDFFDDLCKFFRGETTFNSLGRSGDRWCVYGGGCLRALRSNSHSPENMCGFMHEYDQSILTLILRRLLSFRFVDYDLKKSTTTKPQYAKPATAPKTETFVDENPFESISDDS